MKNKTLIAILILIILFLLTACDIPNKENQSGTLSNIISVSSNNISISSNVNSKIINKTSQVSSNINYSSVISNIVSSNDIISSELESSSSLQVVSSSSLIPLTDSEKRQLLNWIKIYKENYLSLTETIKYCTDYLNSDWSRDNPHNNQGYIDSIKYSKKTLI